MGMTADILGLDRRFGLPGIASVEPGNRGLPKVQVTTPQSKGEIYLHGAHVTSWKPAGAEEVLFLSPRSRWEDGHAIRGGVPISFPWFADKADDPPAPAHGFVRTKAWQIESIMQAGDAVTVSMSTESDAETRQWCPAEFRLLHCVTFGPELTMELAVTNTAATPLRFEEAFHAYHNIGDVEQVRTAGLDGVAYLDKTDANREKTQHGDVVIQSETDRVYLDTQRVVELDDPVLHRRIVIAKDNSFTTVVWNPWTQKATALADLGEDQWPRMLCIETSNVGAFAVNLAPGQRHSMKATLSVAPL
jgi:glucose-6-phosphate 1-epimerase